MESVKVVNKQILKLEFFSFALKLEQILQNLLKGSSYFYLSVEKIFRNCTLSYHNCLKVSGFLRKKEMIEASPEVSRGANQIAICS